ncbi:MAG: hypothetical protein WCK67_00475 [bacterium]
MIKKNCLTFSLLLMMLHLPAIADESIQSPFKQGLTAPKQEQTQSVQSETTIEPPKTQVQVNNPLNNPLNKLGVVWAQNAIIKADDLLKKKKTIEAKAIIKPLETWLIDATEAHTELYKTLRGIETAKVQAELERELALSFAILRDKAELELGLINIEEKQYDKAVEELVSVVKSQPKTALGMQAYDALKEIGFTYEAKLSEEQKTQEIKPF